VRAAIRSLGAMTRNLTVTARVNAPARAAWEVVGPQFDRVGEWASSIPRSTVLVEAAACSTAPVAGRTCSSSLPGLPEISEKIVAYDDDRMELTYTAASGMPWFVARATNTWRITPDGDGAAVVTVIPAFEGKGLAGRVLCVAMRPMLRRISRTAVADLAHFVEHGEPSPRKRAQG
jgi:hypothetical protein